MSVTPVNIHGTAIVIGSKGLVFVGPSGIGKSTLAFACLAAAQRIGLFAALVSDDQVLVSRHENHIVARRPETIAGLIELRGSGIAKIETISPAILHVAVLPVRLQTAERVPPDRNELDLFGRPALPLLHLSTTAPDPLAILSAFIPFCGGTYFCNAAKTSS